MFINPAYAQTGGGGDFVVQMMPLLLIFVVFWFFLIRPQQKKAKEHRQMVSAIRRGDQVITAGGLVGRVTKVLDDVYAQVEVADNVRVKVVKSTLSDVLAKGEPAKSDAKRDSDKSGGKSASNDDDKGGEKKPLFSFGSKK